LTIVRNFHSIDASHAVSDDGSDVHIEFLDRNQVEYRQGQRKLTINREAYFRPTGVPEGSILWLDSEMHWNDGIRLSEPEREQILADFRAAAAPLLTKFYLK
jgi:hypothetical protein